MSAMRPLRVVLLALLAITLSGQPAFPQADDLKTLKKEIDALKEEQRALRKELQDLANSLRERGGPGTRDVRDLTLGVDRHPSQGSDTAVLTLVEFSDYQCPFCGLYVRETSSQIRRDYVETGKQKSTRLNSSHITISYAVFCLKKKKKTNNPEHPTQYPSSISNHYGFNSSHHSRTFCP